MAAILWTALGGSLGALLRFELSNRLAARFGTAFPLGTLFVNVAGSFGMGLLAGAIAVQLVPQNPWHDFIAEGLFGALTTFSTFSMDTFKMFHTGAPVKGVLNAMSSMVLCLGAVSLGHVIMAG